jgi:hypothetical protein
MVVHGRVAIAAIVVVAVRTTGWSCHWVHTAVWYWVVHWTGSHQSICGVLGPELRVAIVHVVMR